MADAPRLLTPDDVDAIRDLLTARERIIVHTLRAAWGESDACHKLALGLGVEIGELKRERDAARAALREAMALLDVNDVVWPGQDVALSEWRDALGEPAGQDGGC